MKNIIEYLNCVRYSDGQQNVPAGNDIERVSCAYIQRRCLIYFDSF
jgi:hypothetical protein